MDAEQHASEMACEALQAVLDQCFSNLRQGTPALEELHKASVKYQAAMEAANTAAAAFVDAFAKVAVTAARARGGTAELGQSMQKLITRHHVMINDREAQARKMSEQFISPLQKRLKTDNKSIPRMEEDFKSNLKAYRSDLKKAGQSTVKAQKTAQRKGEDPTVQAQVDRAMETLMHKSLSFEAFVQRSLRNVMIQERRRYCYLVDNYISVFNLDFKNDEATVEHVKDTLVLANLPEELPPSSEAVIAKNASRGIMYDPPTASASRTASTSGGSDAGRPKSPHLPRTPITMEIERRVSGQAQSLPPGAPYTGVVFEPGEDQVNPRSRRFTNDYR